ncbi:MAG: hypothetical protein ACYCQJ_09830 [Nitrososphaerales archaeon]
MNETSFSGRVRWIWTNSFTWSCISRISGIEIRPMRHPIILNHVNFIRIPAGALLSWFKYVYALMRHGVHNPWNRSKKLSQDSKSFLDRLRTNATRVNYSWGIKYVLGDPDAFLLLAKSDSRSFQDTRKDLSTQIFSSLFVYSLLFLTL